MSVGNRDTHITPELLLNNMSGTLQKICDTGLVDLSHQVNDFREQIAELLWLSQEQVVTLSDYHVAIYWLRFRQILSES